MVRLIKLTLLADLASCLVMFFSYLLINPKFAFLALFYSFGNILIPTFIAVLVFQLLRKKINLSNSFRTIALQTFILTVILFLGIFIWATIDVLLFGHLHREHWNITKEFNSEFKPWLPALFSLAFFIPLIDRRISRNDTKLEDKYNR
ncbi:MAG: hypothetical protein A3D31_02825 [Candidatus Fluviicola riflensis]|nr:MAG: hypothetical protein CHH17_12215 [Candidatus Fluviicola riflensis]OGS78922.1 MAG: hypothetical protein A3D31_02825 [Candidatus Fluviicola riflensis]OGS85944.1 MAG: hypothetical protein A3E30_10310 [Fluviicola sp. RIFCSPHIGHO2_12_FULL_43_24]OGS86353.1 MAG: hypothetical protein A2724_02280 [Fluviicola sp. RIFCSPHIGHO2_01_FULL_43_53]